MTNVIGFNHQSMENLYLLLLAVKNRKHRRRLMLDGPNESWDKDSLSSKNQQPSWGGAEE